MGQPAIRDRCRDGSHHRVSWVEVPEDGLVHRVGRGITIGKAREAELAGRMARRPSPDAL